MSLRLARFPLTEKRLREGRTKRKRRQAKRFRFSYIRPNGDPVFVNQAGEKYTQAELLKFFGIQLPCPTKHRPTVKVLRQLTKLKKEIDNDPTLR